MFKRPTLIILSLVAATLLFSASAFVWKTYQSNQQQGKFASSKADYSWQKDSKQVDLDDYIAENIQTSQSIVNKNQRLMLEPELIRFYSTLQSVIKNSKADLVTDSLAVWGIEPIPEVAFSTFIRSPNGQIIAVYVENTVASHISTYYKPETVLEFQAYRLYNYAKGPRLLLVGIKPVEQELALAIKTGIASNTDADINGTDTKDGESTESSAKASQVVEQETTSL